MDHNKAEITLGTRRDAAESCEVLRQLLVAPELAFLMEAHDGISARIAQAAGFSALWASGLSISTALGTRDADEASWSQILALLLHPWVMSGPEAAGSSRQD